MPVCFVPDYNLVQCDIWTPGLEICEFSVRVGVGRRWGWLADTGRVMGVSGAGKVAEEATTGATRGAAARPDTGRGARSAGRPELPPGGHARLSAQPHLGAEPADERHQDQPSQGYDRAQDG